MQTEATVVVLLPCKQGLNLLYPFLCRYKVISDPAGWLNVAKETGLIKVKTDMDRESHFVKDNKYTALIGAYDNGRWHACFFLLKNECTPEFTPVMFLFFITHLKKIL